ncbi:hypothetical protein D6817_01670 [Candidatus Pacearchaeota archaeon]|nr:MAG: hypothetical protein D6817_01670 [Candidatus Pacearchaeota archaeon]
MVFASPLLYLAAILLGIAAGALTGITPGLHINLIAASIATNALAFPTLLENYSQVLAMFVISMAITHTFLDFIPAVLLGAPEEDSFLSILPGHKMLLEGKAFDAIATTLAGSLAALPIILFISLLASFTLKKFYFALVSIIPFALIFISAFMLLREENFFNGLVVFSLSAFLGIATLKLPIREPLLPLLTGLFGISALALSAARKETIPKQKIPTKRELLSKEFAKNAFPSGRELFKSLGSASVSAPLCAFLPGIGSSHAAILASELTNQRKPKTFLFLLGAINTIVMGLSFAALYAIDRARTGAAVAVRALVDKLTFSQFLALLSVSIASGLLAFVVGIAVSRQAIKLLNKMNYNKLSIAIIAILVALTFLLSGTQGLLVLAVASSVGIYAISSRVRRVQLMGALLAPAIIFYLF